MITAPLALGLVANLVAAAIYLGVARIVSARPVDSRALGARRAFAWWWNVLALLSLYGAFADVVTMLEVWTAPLLAAAVHVLLLAILLGLAGLFYYLVYLYTGREGAWRAILVFYGLLWAVLVYWIEALGPNGIKPGVLTLQLQYVRDPADSSFGPVLALLLIVPILTAAIGYFTLFFKAREPTQRYRIAVVSLSILLWFSFSLFGSLAGVQRDLAWIVLSRTIGITAALAVYAAYRPPRWVQRRWGVHGVAQ